VIQDGIASVWNAVTGTKVFVLPGYPSRKAAFSPDGKRLAVSQRRSVTIFDADSGQLRATLTGHQEPVYGVAFSPDGKQIASCSRSQFSGEIKLWEMPRAVETRSLLGVEQRVFEVVFSPDGKYLAAAGASGPSRIPTASALVNRPVR